MKGYIPDSITYVCSSPETFECYFEEENTKPISKQKVVPTFPVETGKKLDSAISWTGLKNPRQVVVDNKPFGNVKIVGLEERGNGGRAYKVTIDDKFYVDLREDVVLDTMLEKGIEKGGLLKGEFVWIKNGNHLKMIRFGSSVYDSYKKTTDTGVHKMTKLDAKGIVPGGIYTMKNGDTYLYLGVFKTYEFQQHDRWAFDRTEYKNMALVKETVHVVVQLYAWNYKSIKDFTKASLLQLMKVDSHYVGFRKSKPAFIQKIGEIDLSSHSIVEMIRKTGEDNNVSKNPYPHNQYCTHICIGENEPYLHPTMEKFTKSHPIKICKNYDEYFKYCDDNEAAKKS